MVTTIVLSTLGRALAATVIVPGTANPWLAGITNGFSEPGGDVTPDESPVLFTDFTVGAALHFDASGSAGYQAGSESGPLGVPGYFVGHAAEDGIGEIDNALANGLIGVFLDNSQPDISSPPTNVFDFSTDDTRNYQVLRPVLRQPFYIGSGTNAGGVPQIVIAPAGATRLFLGIQDGFGWYNNSGSFTVNVGPPSPLPGIGSFSVLPGPAPIRSSNPWTFSAVYSTLVPDLRLRVQTTLTTNNEASWTYLPGNMTHVDANWTLDRTVVPTGDCYFRVIASAPGYVGIIHTTTNQHHEVQIQQQEYYLRCATRRGAAVFTFGAATNQPGTESGDTTTKAKELKNEQVTGIGGVFFRVKDPKGMAAWYRENLGIQSKNGYANFIWRDMDHPEEMGHTAWAMFPTNTTYFGQSSSSLMINYRVASLDRMLEQLRRSGVKIEKAQDFDYGRFAWIMDPEGNRIELWEPKGK